MREDSEVSDDLRKDAADSVGIRAYWPKFSAIYASGVLAAASIGKIGPVSGELRGELGLSISQVGLISSSVTATAAVLGLLVGFVTRSAGKKSLLLSGLVVMAASGALLARLDGFTALLATRLLESLGYVVVVVTAPVLVMSLGNGARRTAALAVWGTFLPVGLALGSFAGGTVSAVLGWRAWLAIAAGAVAVLAVLVAATVPRGTIGEGRSDDADAERARSAPLEFARPLALASGFATASAVIVSLVTLFPTYLAESFGVPTAQAGTLTGLISLIGVIGGFVTSGLLRRGTRIARVFVVGVLMPVGALVAFAGFGGVVLSVGGAVLVALANEAVVAAVFAAVPMVVSSARRIGTANGLVAQLGSLGSLAGPPLMGLVVTVAGGWWVIGPVTLVVCLVGVALLRGSVRYGH
ncbi:Predicted arabinose efflux permease, MFS family [Actinopolyspora xinjiangensis]|uniref:Predicted arabinose efflux permease, MFS family n=1 Tax=Actinopolyspora xinjiangensis TaxID=405564 RepID=A0A1H0S0C0_9ACTN|nr:MFS transporter [Actinopolyspora xinjiangensis]SDP35271.1 Predicted arabinose efflux permease, MFS family [Actinopolyspora xinjiangensis]